MSNTIKVLLIIGLIAFIYFAAFNEKEYVIVIGGPVKTTVLDSGGKEREISDVSVIRKFSGSVYAEKGKDGKAEPVLLSRALGLDKANIGKGILKYEYLEDKRQLWLLLEYSSPRKVDNNGLVVLVKTAKQVFSKGAAKQFSDQLRVRNKGVGPLNKPVKIFVRQYRN